MTISTNGKFIELSTALSIFLINAAIFIAWFTPEIQGYGDAIRGWNQFNALWGGNEIWGPDNQISLRIFMTSITLAELFILSSLKLIKHEDLLLYLVLPMSAYLATKLKIEFIFFPFAIISTRLNWKTEIGVLAAILGLSLALNENNGFIIAFYRISLFTIRTVRPKAWAIILAAASILIIDYQMHVVARYVPALTAYEWTRNIVNPEYSILETFIVFSASMTLSINPQTDYFVGLPATAILLWIAIGRKLASFRKIIDIAKRPSIQALFLTVLFFTSLTHAFQNARYYMFYIPVLREISPRGTIKLVSIMSIPTTCIMLLFYYMVIGAE